MQYDPKSENLVRADDLVAGDEFLTASSTWHRAVGKAQRLPGGKTRLEAVTQTGSVNIEFPPKTYVQLTGCA